MEKVGVYSQRFLDQWDRITPWWTEWYEGKDVDRFILISKERSSGLKSKWTAPTFWVGAAGEETVRRYLKGRKIDFIEFASEDITAKIDFSVAGKTIDVKTQARMVAPAMEYAVNVMKAQEEKSICSHFLFASYNLKINACTLMGVIGKDKWNTVKKGRSGGERVTQFYSPTVEHYECGMTDLEPVFILRKWEEA